MERMLGAEYADFLASYERPRRGGLRLNALKNGSERLPDSGCFHLSPVAWTPGGFYYAPEDRPGKHPFHECGVYYMQEPSAMAVAALSGVKPGMRVLDLCAAPGGKSTQLASMLGGEGLLVSNEIHPARARILSQNIERMGAANCIVTNETPERLKDRFALFFDTVVVDAPCSGEGMFVKEPEAIPNWSLANVELCADRQLGILECAAEMTAPGGTLVYSTCTFAPLEDERNCAVFLARHPEFVIADLPGSSILKHMILRTDADILFRAVFSVSIAFLRIIAFNQSQRYFPLIQEAQQLLRIPIVHMNINSRVRPDIGRERGNDRIFADGHGHPDRNQRVYVRLFPKLIPDDFFILFHGVQSGIKNSSLLCQGQHLLLIAEKLYPIVVFKIMDLLCHGRLGEIKLCGGFCKIHCMADSQKACYAEIKHVYSSIESYIGIIVLSGDRVGTDKTIKIIY